MVLGFFIKYPCHGNIPSAICRFPEIVFEVVLLISSLKIFQYYFQRDYVMMKNMFPLAIISTVRGDVGMLFDTQHKIVYGKLHQKNIFLP